MKKSNKKLAIGTPLLCCLPLFVIAAGILSALAPKSYFSTALIEPSGANFEEVNKAFQEVVQPSAEVRLEEVRNTDLVAIHVRAATAQQAADKANMIASALQQKLQVEGPQPLKILSPAEPASISATPSVLGNMVLADILGLLPAIVGLILVILGISDRLSKNYEAGQTA